jgi:hypothetical protein
VFFSWIVYKTRKDRDKVNAKVMKDPRLADMMSPTNQIFDSKRMIFGGFKVSVAESRRPSQGFINIQCSRNRGHYFFCGAQVPPPCNRRHAAKLPSQKIVRVALNLDVRRVT